MFHRFISFFNIILTNSFKISISNNWDGMISNHCIRIITGQIPNWHNATFLIFIDECANKMIGSLLFNNGVQRVCGSIGIPERKNSVISCFLVLMNFHIHTSVSSVNILIEVWRKHRVVQ